MPARRAGVVVQRGSAVGEFVDRREALDVGEDFAEPGDSPCLAALVNRPARCRPAGVLDIDTVNPMSSASSVSDTSTDHAASGTGPPSEHIGSNALAEASNSLFKAD